MTTKNETLLFSSRLIKVSASVLFIVVLLYVKDITLQRQYIAYLYFATVLSWWLQAYVVDKMEKQLSKLSD